MAISTTKYVLLFTIVMVSMNGINSQLLTTIFAQRDIITLLENITDTSTTMSTFLPHLENLLKNQENVQRLTNLILQNKTDMCAAEDVTSILQEILEDQQINSNVTSDLMHNYTSTLSGMANAIVQMEETQSHMANDLNQSADTQTHINETLNLMANTQSEVAVDLNQSVDVQTHMDGTLIQVSNTLNQSVDTQNRIDNTLDQIANTQRQMANTQTQMANTQTQMANTQTETANALTQVVNLLQRQSEQLQNMTATMMYMVGQLTTQNQLISLQPNDIRDCSDLASRGAFPSGSYTIQSWDNLGSFRVYCDMDTDGGGWTVFQRRFDGTVDFYRGWDAYEDGFGSPDGEYWLGLRQLHRMTGQGVWTLRIDLEDFETNTAFAEYRSFAVEDAASHYGRTIGAYSGTAGDSLAYSNNQAFTTNDSDHDMWRSGNCAQERQGAWWYIRCGDSNLNGLYLGASQDSSTGMTWRRWKSSWEVLKRSEMKIRRTQ